MTTDDGRRTTVDRFARWKLFLRHPSSVYRLLPFLRLPSTVLRPLSFTNAQIISAAGLAESIRFTSRVLALNTPAQPEDRVFDLQGAFVFPGLINAHDHLELNHFGR